MVTSNGPFSQEAAEHLFEFSSDGQIIFDEDGHIIRCNKESGYILGYTAQEMRSLHIDDFLPKENHDLRNIYREKFVGEKRPESIGAQMTALRKDGSEIPINVSLHRMEIVSGNFILLTIKRRMDAATLRGVPQLFRVISGKNPFQLWLMFFFIVASAPILLVQAAPPNSVQKLVPPVVVIAWAAATTVASLANIVGVYWRGRVEAGTYLELISCYVLALANLVYPVAILTASRTGIVSSSNIWYAVVLLGSSSFCAVGRAMQLLRDRREIRRMALVLRALGRHADVS